MNGVFYKLKFSIMRHYYDVDIYEFKKSKKIECEYYNDYCVNMENVNFKKKYEEEFNFVSKNRCIIEYEEDDISVQYIIFRIEKGEIIYGVTEKAIEFNPQKDVLLFFKKIKEGEYFKNQLIEFYFENKEKEFYKDYTPRYYAIFENYYRGPKFDYEIFKIENYFEPIFFKFPIFPNNFKLTKQNKNKAKELPIAIRDRVFRENMGKFTDLNISVMRKKRRYVDKYMRRRVNNEYDINNPEGNFFDFDDEMTANLSYMYINNVRFDFDENAENVNVPKGDYALYYNRKDNVIGIRYVDKRKWFKSDKPQNPVLRSYVYLKKLSDSELNQLMKPVVIDFYTKDHFHLWRLNYTREDIKKKNDNYVMFKDMEYKFNLAKNGSNEGRAVTWAERHNPYIDVERRYEY